MLPGLVPPAGPVRSAGPGVLPEQIGAEQRADLVAGERPPPAGHVIVGYCHGQPVAVRVVGDHQIGTGPAGHCQREVERARLLWIWEGHRAEVGVGLGLRLDDVRWRESRLLKRPQGQVTGDAVQRRVDEAQPGRSLRSGGNRADRVQVSRCDLITVLDDQRAVRSCNRHLGQRAE